MRFPIIADPKDFPSACNDALAEIHPDHRAIIDRFQPYYGIDGFLLGLLNDLCTIDKHRLVIPIPYTSGVTLMAHPVELGAEIMRVRVPQRILEPDVEMWSAFTPTIAFSEERPVLDTIDYIASAVIRVIREFEPLT